MISRESGVGGGGGGGRGGGAPQGQLASPSAALMAQSQA